MTKYLHSNEDPASPFHSSLIPPTMDMDMGTLLGTSKKVDVAACSQSQRVPEFRSSGALLLFIYYSCTSTLIGTINNNVEFRFRNFAPALARPHSLKLYEYSH